VQSSAWSPDTAATTSLSPAVNDDADDDAPIAPMIRIGA